MEPIFYHGIWRMDWGFGNPNLTGAFIATLIVGVWIFAFLHKHGFWFSLAPCAALAVCLAHTLSRGGLAGVICGLLPVIFFAPRPWSVARLSAVAGGGAIAIAATIFFKADDRLLQGVVQEDKSISNRLVIWERVPAMMAASPEGWGLGNAAQSYEQWFQPLDQQDRYLHLVSSHLTWLVELSWPLRCAYVAFWVGIFLLTFPALRLRWLTVPFGVWVAFFVTGIFSHVAQDWRLWIVPFIFATLALCGRITQNQWPPKRHMLLGGLGAVAIAFAFALVGLVTQTSPAKGTWNAVYIGAGVPQTWVLVSRSVFGQNFGKTIRRYMEREPNLCLGVAFSPSSIPNIDEKIVLAAGAISAEEFTSLKRARKVVLLNTTLSPKELSKEDTAARNLRVLFGELSQSSAKIDWQTAGFREELSGKGDYLGDWAEILKLH